MSDPSSTLLRLIDWAERAICCRASATLSELEELERQIGKMQPPVGAVLSRAPVLLTVALLETYRGAHWDRRWMLVIGVLLPMVRDDLSNIIEARRRPLEPDAPYHRGQR